MAKKDGKGAGEPKESAGKQGRHSGQKVCKPGSVTSSCEGLLQDDLARASGVIYLRHLVTEGLVQPTRALAVQKKTGSVRWKNRRSRSSNVEQSAPMWPCFRWGLPCHARCRARGALLPHPFTLTLKPGRFAFCGTFPRVAAAGGYPAPFFCKARTFLTA